MPPKRSTRNPDRTQDLNTIHIQKARDPHQGAQSTADARHHADFYIQVAI